jgi:hypothetical protein
MQRRIAYPKILMYHQLAMEADRPVTIAQSSMNTTLRYLITYARLALRQDTEEWALLQVGFEPFAADQWSILRQLEAAPRALDPKRLPVHHSAFVAAFSQFS